jgi:hypothetical protein
LASGLEKKRYFRLEKSSKFSPGFSPKPQCSR